MRKAKAKHSMLCEDVKNLVFNEKGKTVKQKTRDTVWFNFYWKDWENTLDGENMGEFSFFFSVEVLSKKVTSDNVLLLL